MRQSLLSVTVYIIFLLGLSLDSFAKPISKPHIDLELISNQRAIKPGQTFTLATRLKMDKGWHIYWTNPGDSGLATKLSWTIPTNFTQSDTLFPYPRKLQEGNITVYGYKGEILILKDITAPANLKPGSTHSFKVKVDWLICKEVCLPPNSATLSLELPVTQGQAEPSSWANLFTQTRKLIPADISPNQWATEASANKTDIILRMNPKGNSRPNINQMEFYPTKPELIQISAPQKLIRQKEGYTLQLKPDPYVKTPPTRLEGILLLSGTRDNPSAREVLSISIPVKPGLTASEIGSNFTVSPSKKPSALLTWIKYDRTKIDEAIESGRSVFIDFTASWCLNCKLNKINVLTAEPVQNKFREKNVALFVADWTKSDPIITKALAGFKRAGVPLNVYYHAGKSKPIVFPEILSENMVLTALDTGILPNNMGNQESYSLFMLLIFSFVGGLILNVMPCVFPVLSIKVLSFVEQAGEDRKKIRAHGLIFTGGIVISFLVLAILVIILGQSGNSVSGWGFQLQSPVFVSILGSALFLFGLNMLGVFEIGTSLTRAGQATTTGSGYVNSFLLGILATVVGAPCLGPFLGVATGVALIDPVWWKSLSIFIFIAMGMAFPYVILAFYPSLLRFLPKPGRWMESFKHIMGFLILGTVILLVWLLGEISGMTALTMFLISLLLLSIGAWVYGRWGTIVQKMKTRVIAWIIALLFVTGALTLVLYYSDGENPPSTSQTSGVTRPKG